jgi:hypothetical protein
LLGAGLRHGSPQRPGTHPSPGARQAQPHDAPACIASPRGPAS